MTSVQCTVYADYHSTGWRGGAGPQYSQTSPYGQLHVHLSNMGTYIMGSSFCSNKNLKLSSKTKLYNFLCPFVTLY